MKILCNENDEKEMKALLGIEPAHNGKRMAFLAATLPTELYKLTTNSYQTPHLTSEYATRMF